MARRICFSLCLVIASCGWVQVVGQAQKPITKQNLFSALRKGKEERKTAAVFIELIREYGVDFYLTTADENTLRRYGAYLGKSGLDGLIKAIRDNYHEIRLRGFLTAANDPMPADPAQCDDIPSNALRIYLGTSVFWTTIEGRPFPAITIGGEDLLVLEKTPNEKRLYVSAVIRGDDGRVIATIQRNSFRINQNNYFYAETPDDHTLIVHDQYNNTAISVRYLNDTSVRVLGRFFSPGYPPVVVDMDKITVTFSVARTCIGNVGGFRVGP